MAWKTGQLSARSHPAARRVSLIFSSSGFNIGRRVLKDSPSVASGTVSKAPSTPANATIALNGLTVVKLDCSLVLLVPRNSRKRNLHRIEIPLERPKISHYPEGNLLEPASAARSGRPTWHQNSFLQFVMAIMPDSLPRINESQPLHGCDHFPNFGSQSFPQNCSQGLSGFLLLLKTVLGV